MTAILFGLLLAPWQEQTRDEPVFSGPQVGEKLPPLAIRDLEGTSDDTADVVAEAAGKPLLLIFFHNRTRPAFGLTRALLDYARTRKKDGLQHAVVFLTEDPTSTENWLKNVSRYFKDGARLTLSPDGLDGPGAYGLNRNVQLTVLVGKEGKVTANYALVQPSLQADGPKIAKALVDVLGGEMPDITQFGQAPGNQARMMRMNPEMQGLLRPLMRELDEDGLRKVVAAVDEYVGENRRRRQQLGQAAKQIVDSGGLRRVASADAKKQLREWAKLAPAPRNPQPARGPDAELQGLLRGLIQKTNSPEAVTAAAKKIEAYVAKNPAGRVQIGDICRRIIAADRLATYGTPAAQEYLKKWAQEYKAKEGDAADKPRQDRRSRSETSGK